MQAHGIERGRERRGLLIGLSITLVILLLEVAGGLLTRSLALLADAGHMLVDLFSLGLSLLALSFALRPSTKRFTYGYYRLEILAALANGVLLLGVCLYISYQAYQRLLDPPQIDSLGMLGIAAIGLLANLAVLLFIRGGKSLNLRSAFLHVLGDTLSSIGIIVGGVIIMVTGWSIVDPLISIFIAILIAISGYRVIREALDILLEVTPKDIDLERVIEAIRNVGDVQDVHDLHLWSISSGLHALSAHLVTADISISRSERIAAQVRDELADRFGIRHCTLQFEREGCGKGILCDMELESKE